MHWVYGIGFAAVLAVLPSARGADARTAPTITTTVLDHGVPTGTTYRTQGDRTERLDHGVPTGESWVRNGSRTEHRIGGVPTGMTTRSSR